MADGSIELNRTALGIQLGGYRHGRRDRRSVHRLGGDSHLCAAPLVEQNTAVNAVRGHRLHLVTGPLDSPMMHPDLPSRYITKSAVQTRLPEMCIIPFVPFFR